MNNELWLGSEGGGGGPTPPPSGYNIERSVRFNSADSAHLSRTPASAGNRKTWTWAGWVKRSALAPVTGLFAAGSNASNVSTIYLPISGAIQYYDYVGGTFTTSITTTAVYRDFSAWMHVVVAADTTQGTAADRIRIYVNGVKVTAFSTATYPSQSADTFINSATKHTIYKESDFYANYGNGYLADIHFIDGQALDPTSFGEFDSNGVWQPKAYTGSYGTNGFHLPFSDNSTAAALGTDTSGNGNTWTVNNIQATVQTGRLYAQASGTSTSAFSSATLLGNFPATVGGSYAIYDADLVTPVTSATFSYLYSFSSVVEVLVSADGTNWTSKGNQSSSYTTVSHTSAFRYVRWFYSTFNFGITNNPAGNDSLVDSPTNYGTDTGVGGEVRGNYATLNPVTNSAVASMLSNGNLQVTDTVAGWDRFMATLMPQSGKWYVECFQTNYVYGSTVISVGIAPIANSTSTVKPGSQTDEIAYENQFQKIVKSATSVYTNLPVYTNNTVIGLAIDMDGRSIEFFLANTSLGSVSMTSGVQYGFVLGVVGSGTNAIVNFGQRPFTYAAPSGFKALCTANLPSTTITTSGTYTGNGVTDGPFVYLNGVPTAMTIGGNSVIFGTTADKLSNGFKIRTNNTTYNQNASTYNYTITSTGDPFKTTRAQSNP